MIHWILKIPALLIVGWSAFTWLAKAIPQYRELDPQKKSFLGGTCTGHDPSAWFAFAFHFWPLVYILFH